MLQMEPPGKRKRGRPKRRFMDALKDDMKVAGLVEEDIQNRNEWRENIRCYDT